LNAVSGVSGLPSASTLASASASASTSASPSVPAAAADRYAVFGNPVAHSRSPAIHAQFAAQTGQAITYEKRLAPLDGFAAAIRDFVGEGGRGANVTVPFKLEAYALATRLTERAAAAGAVNTLSFGADGIVGDNTDGIGLVTDLVVNAGVPIRGRRVLLLGAGGAAQGAMLPLLDAQPSHLVIANRTPEKAAAIAAHFNLVEHGGPSVVACAVDALEALDAPFDIVINATAASLSDAVPAVPACVFASGTLAYDMMYASAPTPFMRFAAGHGARVRDGLGMLVEQAAEAFFVWRGVRPETATVLAALRAAL
jgi:shikimate dehydrogenase